MIEEGGVGKKGVGKGRGWRGDGAKDEEKRRRCKGTLPSTF
jgi:hypothetical protein